MGILIKIYHLEKHCESSAVRKPIEWNMHLITLWVDFFFRYTQMKQSYDLKNYQVRLFDNDEKPRGKINTIKINLCCSSYSKETTKTIIVWIIWYFILIFISTFTSTCSSFVTHSQEQSISYSGIWVTHDEIFAGPFFSIKVFVYIFFIALITSTFP